ncbi:Beta-lactamase hydrolase-like protein [Colletotrichum tropicale]|nr:Beta-lactamase hydrolase-like protein [Colletotrichum tropicale]
MKIRRTLSTIPKGGVKQSSTFGDKGHSAQTLAQGQPVIHDLFETKTGTWQYVVADPSTREAVVIDPVLDYDRETQLITTVAADQILSLAKSQNYTIVRILETHAHADHLTAASYLQHRLESDHGHKPTVGIGRRIGQVQSLFGQRYGVPQDERQGAFDTLFEDDEVFSIGNLQAVALHLPGHTPDHLGYKIGDNVFCGDSLFHVDIGTARLSLIAMLAVIEMAERPFATIGLSQSWFVRGEHPFSAPDEEDIDYGLVEVVSMVKDVKLPPTAKQIKARKMLSTIQEKKEKKPEKRKRKTLTKKNPYEVQLQRQQQQQQQEQHRTL